MLNFNRRDRAPEPTPPGKFALKPQEAGGTGNATAMATSTPSVRPAVTPTPLREPAPAPTSTPRETMAANTPTTHSAATPPSAPAAAPKPAPAAAATAPAPAPSNAPAPAAAPAPITPGSKLSIGVNIKLKGVEISDCDVLSIEGNVDATIRSTVMEIAEPGTFNGTAVIDVAEIHGQFTGELTARTRLVIHGTGRVSGKIRYGKLVVAEGGELSGDIQRFDERA